MALKVNGVDIGTPVSFSSQADFTLGSAISFAFGSGVSGQLDNISLQQIPEPSVYAAAAGLSALGLVAWRRRRAK